MGKVRIAKQVQPTKKKMRRKYVATLDTDEEIEDTSQFKVVSHPLKSKVDKICDNIRDHADISELKNIYFCQLTKEDKTNIKDSITP